jgi:hypothetical protein
MGFEVPYINGLIDKFWYVILTNRGRSPNFTDMLNIAESIVVADDASNKATLEQLNTIRNTTHPEIMMNAASFELWMSRNWMSPINKDLDFMDGKSIKLHQIARIVDATIAEIVKIITPIAKKYTLAIAYSGDSNAGSSSAINIWDINKK